MSENIGPKIGIEGEAEYKKQLDKIIQQSKELASEMKTVTSEFDKNDKSQENLTAQSEVLTKQIKNQKKRIELLSKGYEKTEKELDKLQKAAKDASEEFGENSEEAIKAAAAFEKQEKAASRSRIEMNNATTVLNKMERQFDGLQSELQKSASESEDFAEAVEEIGDAAEESSGGFTVMKGALSGLVSGGIQAAAGAAEEFVESIVDMAEETEEYRAMQAKLSGSAESFGYSVDFAKEKYKEFYSYLGDDQMATNAITNLMGLQTSQESLTDLTEAATAVWTAYGDSIPIEGLTESMNETAQVAAVTGNLADALNWAGISEDEFNLRLAELATTQERADFIAQTLNDTYGKSKQVYDDLTEGIRNAKDAEAEFKEKQAEIGEAAEPIREAIVRMKTKGLDILQPAVEFVADLLEDFGDSANDASKKMYDAIDASDEMGKSLKETGEELEESVDALKETMDEMKEGKVATKYLVDALDNLNKKSQRTSEEQYRMEAVIAGLNSLYPELGLAIDDATGKLNKSTVEIADYIGTAENIAFVTETQKEAAEITKNLAAAEEAKKAAYEATMGVAAQIVQKEAEIKELQAQQEAGAISNADAQKMWNEALQKGQGDLNALYQQTANSNVAMTEYQGKMMSVSEALNIANQDLLELQAAEATHREEMAAQDENIKLAKESLDSYNAALAEKKEATNQASEAEAAYREGTQYTIIKNGEAMNAFNSMSEAQQQTAMDLTNAVNSMKENMSNIITSQMDMFSAFDASIDLSTTDLLNNMQSQVDGVRAWEENLVALSDTAINKNLLQYLMDMGPDGAGYVQLFASMTTEEMDKANELWEDSIDIKELTNGWGIELTEAGAEAIASGMEGVDEAIQAAGMNSVLGLVVGVNKAMDEAEAAGVELGTTVIDATNEGLGCNSPSEKTKESGEYVDEGLINGLENGKHEVLRIAQYLAEELIRTINDGLGTYWGTSNKTLDSGRMVSSGLAEGIRRGQPEVMYAIEDACRSVIQTIDWNLDSNTAYMDGYNVSIGLANGIYAGQSAVINAAADVAWSAVRAARNALDIHSPSRVFWDMGDNSANAYAGGLLENQKKVMHSVMDTLDYSVQNVSAHLAAQRNGKMMAETIAGAVRGISLGSTSNMEAVTIVIEGDTITMDGRMVGKGAERRITGNQIARRRARGG